MFSNRQQLGYAGTNKGGSRRTKWSMGALGVVMAGLVLVTASASATIRPSTTASVVKASTGYPSTVTVRDDGDYPCLDPYNYTCYAGTTTTLWPALYDQLIIIGVGGSITPYLATSWHIKPSIETFTIRKGVTCQNGQKLNASAVAAALTNYFAREAATGDNLAGTWGPTPYTVTGDNKTNTVTVQLSSSEPRAYVGFLQIPIVCPAGLQPVSDKLPGAGYDTTSYGSGPYELVSAEHGIGVTMRLNKKWTWGPNGTTAADLPKKLVFTEVDDETTAANELLSGQLDISSVAGPDIERLVPDKSLGVFKFKATTSNVISFNENPPHPTADPAVRKAIAEAVNVKAYGAASLGPAYASATNVLAPIDECYQNDSKLYTKYDPSAVAGTLTADGYTKGSNGYYEKGGQELTINVVSQPARLNQAGDYIASALNEVGINTDEQDLTTGAGSIAAHAGQFDVFTDFLASTSPSPATEASLFIAANGQDFNHALDPTAYSLFLKAVGSVTCTYWKQFYAQLISNDDVIAPVYEVIYTFTRDKIRLIAPESGFEAQFIRAG